MGLPLHVTFGSFAESNLKRSFEFNDDLKGDTIALDEDLSIGPVKDSNGEPGMAKRKDWLTMIGMDTTSLAHLLKSDQQKYELIRSGIVKRDLYVWCGSDSTSRIGFLKLIHELNYVSGTIYILDYPLTIQYPKGEFPFVNIGMLQEKQIGKLNGHFRRLQREDQGILADEWTRTSNNNSILRVIEEEKIVHTGEDYFDELLMSHCTKEFRKSARVVAEVLADVFDRGQTVPYSFLNWRLRELVHANKLIYEGSLKDLRDYMIKLED